MLEICPVRKFDRPHTIDKDKISYLFQDAWRSVMGYARFLCRSLPNREQIAQDIIQDAAIKILSRHDKVPIESFQLHFAHAVKDAWINQVRSWDRRKEDFFDDITQKHQENVFQLDSGLLMVMTLREALAQLAISDRKALILHTLVGLTIEEISLLEGCSVHAMEKRLERAQRKIRKLLLSDENVSRITLVTLGNHLIDDIFQFLNEAIEVIPNLQNRKDRRGRKQRL